VGVRYTICHWATNRTDPQNLLSTSLDVPLHFIGFVNFYCHFIQDFSTIARPLFDLTRSDQAWNWGTKEQEAFECLKMAVTTALILASLQDSEPFCIEADSSDFASGAILSQQLPREEK